MWGGKLAVLLSEILFYGDASLNAVVHIPMHLFIFSVEKMYYLHKGQVL